MNLTNEPRKGMVPTHYKLDKLEPGTHYTVSIKGKIGRREQDVFTDVIGKF